MNTLRGFPTFTQTEFKLFMREPIAVFFQFIFPTLLLALFGTLFGSMPIGNASGAEMRMIDFYLPALMVVMIGQAGFLNLPVTLSNYREGGILKRFHASPVHLHTYLLAQIAVQIVVLLLSAVLMMAVAELLFDARFVGNLAYVFITFVLSVICMFSLGFVISGVFSAPKSNQAVGNFVFLIMFFLSGATVPHQLFPDWLVDVSYALPLTYAVQALSGFWMGDPMYQHTSSLLVLAGTSVVAVSLARYTFRWKA